jgi:hypothetical protein
VSLSFSVSISIFTSLPSSSNHLCHLSRWSLCHHWVHEYIPQFFLQSDHIAWIYCIEFPDSCFKI